MQQIFNNLLDEIEWMFELADFEFPEDQWTMEEEPDDAEKELFAMRKNNLLNIQNLTNKLGNKHIGYL